MREGRCSMKELTINEFLRYGLAGGVGLLCSCLSYVQPLLWIQQDHAGPLVLPATATLPFLFGALAYILYRAVFYPLLYRIVAWSCCRRGKMIDLDIIRWENTNKVGAIQGRLQEWASQVHFLYCSFLAIVLIDCVSRILLFAPTCWRKYSYAFSLILLIGAVIHHIRYNIWEKAIFEHDRSL